MSFGVAIGAQQSAFLQLHSHLFPSAGQSLAGYAEILAVGFNVVEDERFLACAVSTRFTCATFV